LPFLSDALQEVLEAERVDTKAQGTIISRFGDLVRERLAAPSEESLAGGLANTIAGRIANHHDFHGGAWAVDGACASSLLAVCEACELLAAETVDAAVVGAVDLSLDPFELVGFSRNGALAREDMRVFDRRAEGFWPGEGCGFAVLMRADDARLKGHEVLAELAGWGISTDGRGGLTRPTVDGQLRALSAAYGRASIPPDDLSYLEAHGTGTPMGDPTEIRALAHFVKDRATALPVGSIKANLGHTKAAAGFAGLIKAVLALHEGVYPPHVGCYDPHPVFAETGYRLTPAGNGGIWPRSRPSVAGVSAFGFGGINAHVVLRGRRAPRSRSRVPPPARPQDCELLILSADARATLARELRARAYKVQGMSLAEVTDFAAAAATEPHLTCRAAVLASRPDELAKLLERASRAAETGETLLDPAGCVFVAETEAGKRPAVGFLFPGQAAPSRPSAGSWAHRFAISADIIPEIAVHQGTDPIATEVAQPAIMGAALAGMRVLRASKLEAQAALGHSLGELAALVWAGVISEADLLPLARARGAAISRYARPGGTMVRVEASEATVRELIDGLPLSVACLNAQCETVVSGAAIGITALAARANSSGIRYSPLSVSHAFHSPDMAPAQKAFARPLDDL
jgi:enediyne polyketide synthase